MPNYCENHLTITGLRKDLEQFRDRAALFEESSEGDAAIPLDFSRLLPIQEPLFDIEKCEDDWMMRHWGCRGSAEDAECYLFYDDEGRGQLVYEYLTPRTPSDKLIVEVSASYPTLTFSLIAFVGESNHAALFIARRGILISGIDGFHYPSLMDEAFKEGRYTAWRFVPHLKMSS